MKTDKESDNFTTVISGFDWRDNKMLLIEDDRISIILMREIFTDTGIQILSAVDGKEGLRLFDQNPDTNVILLDLRLPDIDGFAVYKGLQKINQTVPVIMITANASQEIAGKCRKLGFYGFMYKPLDIAGLIKMVNIALKYKPN